MGESQQGGKYNFRSVTVFFKSKYKLRRDDILCGVVHQPEDGSRLLHVGLGVSYQLPRGRKKIMQKKIVSLNINKI
jgi:hypothetical protein